MFFLLPPPYILTACSLSSPLFHCDLEKPLFITLIIHYASNLALFFYYSTFHHLTLYLHLFAGFLSPQTRMQPLKNRLLVFVLFMNVSSVLRIQSVKWKAPRNIFRTNELKGHV